MKHSVELKMPRLFGGKKNKTVEVEEEKMKLQHSVDIKLPGIFGSKKVDETTGEEPEASGKSIMVIGGVLVAGFAVGYLVGHHNGANKRPQNILIMK